jgi:dTDP-4-dehydrorhamnose reductase
MLNLAKAGSEIKVVDDQFGSPTFTQDLARVTKNIIEHRLHFGIYHVVNGGVCSWYEFAQEIFKIKGLDVAVKPIKSAEYPASTPRPQYAILVNTKLPPLRSWQEALREYLHKTCHSRAGGNPGA